MKHSQARAQFLKGDFSEQLIPVRPPWAINEQEFIQTCSTCQKCVLACEQDVLVPGRGLYPTVDFSRGECTFCAACVDACQTGSLTKTVEESIGFPWSKKAYIDQNCLSQKNVVCRICNEQCELQAIQFHYIKNGVFEPQINSMQCTGCGACIHPCPVNAIRIKS